MSKYDFAESLVNSELGKSLGEEMMRTVLDVAELRSYKKDNVIYLENDEVNNIYLVVGGSVKLTRTSNDGREMIIHLAEPFRFIAEAGIFLGKFPANGITVEDSQLLVLQREQVLDMISRYPAFSKRIFHSMANWLKLLVDKIDQLTLSDATARIIYFLFDQAGISQHSDFWQESAEIKLSIKKGEMANMLNMNQATLSRALRSLQDEDALEVSGRVFRLKNIKKLRKLALPPIE